MGTIYNMVNFISSFLYRLNNWSRPQNKYELFNLRHAQARNIIERIFGVLKNRFQILRLAPEYSIEIQARIPAALAALHNFLQVHNSQAKNLTEDSDHAPGGFYAGDDSFIPTGMGIDIEEEQDTSEASRRRNKIADDMWRQYQEVLHQRSQLEDYDVEDSEETDGDNEETDNNDDFYLWHLQLHTKKIYMRLWLISFQLSSDPHITSLSRNKCTKDSCLVRVVRKKRCKQGLIINTDTTVLWLYWPDSSINVGFRSEAHLS